MEKNLFPLSKSAKPILSEQFSYYSRPLTCRLLETMELAKSYHYGEKDYLYYSHEGKDKRVLDLTGGEGANILGHKNPRIMNRLREWIEEGSPNHTQGSIRTQSGELAKKISDTLEKETGEGPWITTFSNSGTEAIEAAIKHCYIYFQHKSIELKQEIDKEINLALIKLKRLNEEELLLKLRELRLELNNHITTLRMNEERKSYLLHQLNNVHTIYEFIDLIRLINDLQLSQRPILLSLENAFHGETMGALSITSNIESRYSFYLGDESSVKTLFISQYIDSLKFDNIINSTINDLLLLVNTPHGCRISKQPFSIIAGAFVEPIQSEAGIISVSANFLALLKKHALQQDFLLVFDEIQSGIYRTGYLAAGTHTDITPDIYTFSKSLGGGVAKIAATTILQRRYIEEFGYLHTSPLSDDDMSSAIALEVLDILQGENSPTTDGLNTAQYLEARLIWLMNKYPEAVKEVRGKGLMLAIEFNDLFLEMGFEFKSICDSRMQGHMISSALLNHEGIRVSPSLLNNLTLKILPSIYLTIVHVEEFILALTNLLEAYTKRDLIYFLSALYPNEDIKNEKTPDLKTNIGPGERPLSVFLCHLIDDAHIKKVTKALVNIPGPKLLKKLAQAKNIANFNIYHAQTITDKNGNEMDIVMIGIPVTSEELKKTFVSKNKYKIVQKVQSALDLAKSIGANTVGLGQFTSIVSANGLYLNPRGMSLSTGNAYTISLTVQSALRSVAEKNIDLPKSTVALIGAAGNIMSVATSLMADHVGKVIMIHHSPIESSLKYQEATRRIIDEIAHSDAHSNLVKVIKRHWSNKHDLLDFLSIPEIKEVFVASSTISDISNADIVLCGASASNGFLDLEIFKKDAVVVDVAVPPSIRPELLSQLEIKRPDLTYHMGGVAQIPGGHSINFFIFPLGVNECYACMAETFSIGFSGQKNFVNIGDLNKSVVLEVQDLANKAGFMLGSYKKKSSL